MSKLKVLVFVAIVLVASTHCTLGADSLLVESRTFIPGQTACTVGVFISNSVPIVGLLFQLELRSVTGGAYFSGPVGSTFFRVRTGGRVDLSPLGTAGPGDEWPPAAPTSRRFANPAASNSCSGPVSRTWSTTAASVDGVSPDAIEYATVSQGDPEFDLIALPAGSDPDVRDSASFFFLFNANGSPGCFEIDSCCTSPANHIGFIDENTSLIIPDFAKGVVCLESAVNQAPVLNCPSSVTHPKDPGQGGAIVNYTVTYFDEDTTLAPVCTPLSGSFFTIGTTFVTCTVTDTFGLADTCVFPVTVVDAEGNRVTVQSDTFFINQTACTIGVYLSNVIPIMGVVLPLDLRSIGGGAFYLPPSGGSPFFARRLGSRLDLSPLGSADPGGDWPAASTTLNRFDVAGGAPCGARTYQTVVSQVGGTSPDAVLYACVSTGDPFAGEETSLQPGVDPLTAGSQSWQFIFDANGNVGCFEIDTCCVRPAAHLLFLDEQTTLQPAGFVKGTICLELNPGTNYPPVVTCPPVIWQSVDGGGVGAPVSFTVDVSDENPTLEAVCTAPSGSFFPLGTTLVTCIATDTAGLADTCSFEVVVHAAQDNSVVVESKTFQPGQVACSVGVFLENTVPIPGLVLPLEARSVSNSSFYLGFNALSRPTRQAGQRLDLSPLGSADPGGRWPAGSTTNNRYDSITTPQCGGPVSNSYQAAVAATPGTSPDGWLFSAVSTGDLNQGEQVSLVPGNDPQFTGSASWVFVFNMDSLEGCFEIDTCCVRPSGHLSFVDEQTNLVAPAFTKGTVCIANCACDCHANPANCSDPAVNVLDVSYEINVAFRGFAEIDDPNAACPIRTTDVNCDGVTSVVDVIKMVDVAFRAGDPATVFCDPCL